MADRDPVGVLREFFDSPDMVIDYSDEVRITAALAELERRQGREARLVALVRGFLSVHSALGATGELVEAARREVNDG